MQFISCFLVSLLCIKGALSQDHTVYTPLFPPQDDQPWSFINFGPFYSDLEMTTQIGTHTYYCIGTPSENPIQLQCDFSFGFHDVEDNLSFANNMINMDGVMFPVDGGFSQQLFVITGGSGDYFGVGGTAMIDDSSGVNEFRFTFEKQPTAQPAEKTVSLWYNFIGRVTPPPLSLVAGNSFYDSNPLLGGQNKLGSYLLSCVAFDSELFPIMFHCQYVFAFHAEGGDMTDAVDVITSHGIMIQDGAGQDESGQTSGNFLQLFTITGGTGIYNGLRCDAIIDGSTGAADMQFKFETPQPPAPAASRSKENADMHAYTPRLGTINGTLFGVTSDTGPMYADADMTMPVGTQMYYCIGFGSDEFQVQVLCDFLFAFHDQGETISDTDDLIYADGVIIRGGDGGETQDLLQLFAIGGGTGNYKDVRGTITIDTSLGVSDFQLFFTTPTAKPSSSSPPASEPTSSPAMNAPTSTSASKNDFWQKSLLTTSFATLFAALGL